MSLYWWSAYGIKQRAYKAIEHYCQEKDVQLLDQSLVLYHLWFQRNTKGSLQISRRYYFEFTSTGEQRYKGRINMLGQQIIHISLDAHRI